jgi:valyl-tRNA synthetase
VKNSQLLPQVRRRIVSSPLHLAGGLAADQLGSLVAIDATRRWWEARGAAVDVIAAPFSASLAMQHAVERELAREGHDRETLGRDAFIERAGAVEDAWRTGAVDLLAGLRVDLASAFAGAATDAPVVVDAARIAFVRLFDAGLLELADRVVDVCPRCTTVVHAADAESGTVSTEAVTVRLQWSDGEGTVDVQVPHPELLPGAVAVAVAEGHPAEGRQVVLPVLGRAVPVVAGAAAEPMLVVPAHDAASHEIAFREGLAPVEVLGTDGTVALAGALAGLPRFGARAEVTALLDAEGAVVGRDEVDDAVARCRACGTVLVPRLGRHWFLHTAELEVAAADAVRQGLIHFSPSGAGLDFLNWAGYIGDWCISHQIWGAHAIPVATCTDCAEPAVGLTPPDTCRKCMAELTPETAVFDARFLGVVWGLVSAGWPDHEAAVGAAARTTLAVRPSGLFTWAVPMAALGLRLAGVAPFASVVVHDASEHVPDPAVTPPEVARLALLGHLDIDDARALWERTASPSAPAAHDAAPAVPDVDLDAVEAALAAAVDDVQPGLALPALAAAVRAGIPVHQRARLGTIMAPLTAAGDDEGGADGLR